MGFDMKFKHALYAGAAVTLLASGANAATIHLVDLGGVTGSQAELGFKVAAEYWGSMFTNNATINLGVKFAALPPNVIGSTGSARQDFTVANFENLFNATKSNSAIDQAAVLPTLTNGGFSALTAGVNGSGNNDNNVTAQLLGKTASKVLYENTSVIKALGGSVANPNALDAQVTFSSTFAFDFDSRDGVNAGTFDFVGVAIHEIGHALGFVSGVDFLDYYGYPNGPGRGALGYDLNDTSIFSALDLYRYSSPGQLDERTGGTKYFSVDGGQTALFGNTFSTGQFNGDGRQASHWKDTPNCQVGNGIMDPTFCFGQEGVITGLDLAAFDAIGWNLSTPATADYRFNTGQAISAYNASIGVPEPSTWALVIMGFGAVGAGLRRRRAMPAIA